MRTYSLISSLLYSYPISLCLGLLVLSVLSSRNPGRICRDLASRRCKVVFLVLWYLQLCVCLSLLISIVIAIRALFTAQTEYDERLIEPYLASCVGVLLYFMMQVAPDPDGPYTISWSHSSTWILALVYELGLLMLFQIHKNHIRSQVFGSVQITLGVARSSILLVMAIAYFALQRYTTRDQDWECEEQDREQLMPNGQPPSTEYGSLKPNQQGNVQPRVEDAQSLGWIDYFIGFRVLLPYLWPSNSWKEQLIIILCVILSASQRLVNILVPYQLGVLVASLKEERLPYKEISIYVLLQGLQGQQGILGSVRALIWIRISQSLYQRLTVAAFEHVLSLSLDFHLSKRIGEVISALNRGSALNTFLDGFAFQLFPMVFDLGVAAVYLFIRFDAFYSLVVIGVMWSYIYMTIYMAKYRGRARREMAKRDREMDAKKTDAIMSYEAVSYNSAQAMEISSFKRTVTNFQEAEKSVLCSLNLLNVTQNLIFTFGIALILGLSGYQIFLGKHSIATFVSLFAYFSQLHAPLAFFGSFYNQVQNNLVDAERMLALFQHKPETTDHPDAIVLPKRSGEIKFTNVNFSYSPQKLALENISFTVSPGTTTALVGESGSGKSTCLKLLFRFYDVKSGAITIDGNDVRNVTLKSLRDQISVVPQDTILFNESLLYNLLYAKPDATLNEVFKACKAASIHQKILGFPNGYDTAVGERGLRLSGGEKQRIAIARALLRNPTIMLLDEATASLDTHTEKEIQSALASITHYRTTIIIAHRLSTVTKADQILVLHEGKIIERGRHVELLRSGKMYKSLWDRQTEAEKGEQTD